MPLQNAHIVVSSPSPQVMHFIVAFPAADLFLFAYSG